MNERIGVFGGTFDPVHIAHLVAAINARDALALDRVLLVVSNEPWQKVDDHEVTPAEDRFALVEAAVAGIDRLEASRIELDRGGPSYTVDTLQELAGPQRKLFLIIGADVAVDSWVRADEVRALAEVVVVTRPGQTPPEGAAVVDIPGLEISGSDLRKRLRDGRSVEFLIPERVLRCIRDRGLYAVSG